MADKVKRVAFGPYLAIAVVLLVLAIVARVALMDIVSDDMETFLLPWYEEIGSTRGLSALATQVGNYNIPYQTCIALMAYLPISALHAYKLLSIGFDVVLAASAVFLYRSVARTANPAKSLLVFAVVFALPTVVLNSAAWGQCDSIYGAFALIAIALLFRKHPYPSAFVLGLAFAFKLQAIFVVPYFFIWFVFAREHRPNIILLVLLVFLGFYLPSTPGLLAGRSLLEPVRVYLTQTVYYAIMTLNYPNLWGLIHAPYLVFKWPAIALAAALVLAALVFVWRRGLNVGGARAGYATLLWTTWAVLLALPSMHERYGYVLTALLVIASFVDRRFIPFAVVMEALEVVLYHAYLWNDSVPVISLEVLSLIYILAFVCFTIVLVKNLTVPAPRGAHAARPDTK